MSEQDYPWVELGWPVTGDLETGEASAKPYEKRIYPDLVFHDVTDPRLRNIATYSYIRPLTNEERERIERLKK